MTLCTFIVKAIESIDAGTLMVASEEKEVFGVFDFVGQEKHNAFDGLLASIDIIPNEKIVVLAREPPVFK